MFLLLSTFVCVLFMVNCFGFWFIHTVFVLTPCYSHIVDGKHTGYYQQVNTQYYSNKKVNYLNASYYVIHINSLRAPAQTNLSSAYLVNKLSEQYLIETLRMSELVRGGKSLWFLLSSHIIFLRHNYYWFFISSSSCLFRLILF